MSLLLVHTLLAFRDKGLIIHFLVKNVLHVVYMYGIDNNIL
jgi:hypothetical protein